MASPGVQESVDGLHLPTSQTLIKHNKSQRISYLLWQELLLFNLYPQFSADDGSSWVSQCNEEGVSFVRAGSGDDDDEDWEDVMEDFEDFWMREPKVKLTRRFEKWWL